VILVRIEGRRRCVLLEMCVRKGASVAIMRGGMIVGTLLGKKTVGEGRGVCSVTRIPGRQRGKDTTAVFE